MSSPFKKFTKRYIKKSYYNIKSTIEDIKTHFEYSGGSFMYKIYTYIRYFIISPILFPFYIFYERSLKIISYIPILWNEQEWDSQGMWSILQKKFERLEKTIIQGDALNRKSESAEIKYIILLLQKIDSHQYYYIAEDKIDKIKKNNDISNNTAKVLRVSELAEELYKQDVEMLFNRIKNSHESWWN